MKIFPILDECSVDELIRIVYSEIKDWQEEAVDYAKYLLKTKGITDAFAKKRILELEKGDEVLWEKEMESRKTERYTIFELIFMTLLWTKYLLRDWHLKSNGYILKRKQRLYSLSLGFLICFLFISFELMTYPGQQQAKIDNLNEKERIDSIAKSKIDWSGIYVFIDTVNNQSKKITWELTLRKENNIHKGILKQTNGKESVSISCIGLLKEKGLEVYPDTIATLFNKLDVSYYDNLFILSRQNNQIKTCWVKIKPYYSLRNNEIGIFNKYSNGQPGRIDFTKTN